MSSFGAYPDKAVFEENVIKVLSGGTAEQLLPSSPDQSLISFFELQIKLSREGLRTILKGKREGMPYKENTIHSYEGSQNLLQEYLDFKKTKKLCFDDVTMDFYYDLRSYMFNDRSFSLNFFGKVIKHLKLFMGEARELGWHANEIYKSKAFIKAEEETDAVYNDIGQLEAIHSVDLTGHPGLKNARDLYLLGAWSGLRFQDYSVLADKARVMGDIIHIETEKTGVFVAIPILPVTREILESYRGEDGTYHYPKPISNQKLTTILRSSQRWPD